MISKKHILILSIIIISVGFVFYELTAKDIEITLRKEGEDLKIQITNRKQEPICFSSCYPYFLEKKEEEWNSYQYDRCPEEDIIETCILPGGKRAFLLLAEIEEKTHRISIPFCSLCKEGDVFKEEGKIYSQEF